LFQPIGHLATTISILQGFAFLCDLGLLLFKPHGITKCKYDRKYEKDSGRSSKMTSLCKWPIKSTTQICEVTRHQYGISTFVSQMSFCGETSGGPTRCHLFCQATDFTTTCSCISNPYTFFFSLLPFHLPDLHMLGIPHSPF